MMSTRMTRHDSRILALSALYCWEISRDRPDEIFSSIVWAFFHEGDEKPLSPYVEYARKIFNAAISNISEIDALIGKCSQGWPVARMPKVDLSIIRLAVAEVQMGEVPLEVAIDEAVELAKEFGNHPSPRFVNGILTAVFREMGYAGLRGKG